MKKIISTFSFGLLFVLSACSTTADTDATTPQNNDSTNAQAQQQQQQLTQDEIAQQQIRAFEANQVKMYTQPVNN